jgi:hypothetical protein
VEFGYFPATEHKLLAGPGAAKRELVLQVGDVVLALTAKLALREAVGDTLALFGVRGKALGF